MEGTPPMSSSEDETSVKLIIIIISTALLSVQSVADYYQFAL